MRARVIRKLLLTCAVAIAVWVSGSCKEPSAPPAPLKPSLAVPVTERAPSRAPQGAMLTTKKENPSQMPSGAPHGAMLTTKKADPSRMPRDRIHAPFRRPGGVPGRMGRPGPKGSMKTDGHDKMPLLREGAGGADELNRRLATLEDSAVKARVEEAFRRTFTTTRNQRSPQQAAAALRGLTAGKVGATTERILGYVAIQSGKGFGKALEHYKKAVALDPKYGEAHYALAFTYVLSDRVAGRQHFEKAMSLGVQDTRGLGDRFYKRKPALGKTR